MAIYRALPPVNHHTRSMSSPHLSEDTPIQKTRIPTTLLTLESSTRLTPSTYLHVFLEATPGSKTLKLLPGEHVTLQFPARLDPLGGDRNLSAGQRCLRFTPCQIPSTSCPNRLSLLAGNGRVTGLIALPRPDGQLTAELVETSGGFNFKALDTRHDLICVAGGTGIACFAAMGTAGSLKTTADKTLIWSIRGEEFGLFENVIDSGLLRREDWSRIKVFVTAGLEQSSAIGGKPHKWWLERFASYETKCKVEFALRRMAKGDVDDMAAKKSTTVLFCGGKNLEWQVRMWALDVAKVFTTDQN